MVRQLLMFALVVVAVFALEKKQDPPICNYSCGPDDDGTWDGDGECDDGGPGSQYFVCAYGSDCSDCDSRPPGKCMNQCGDANEWSGDSVCDDGGPKSSYDICDFGADCKDCGARPEVIPGICTNDCSFSNDGECDDGAPGSSWDLCDLGTDCNDCGERFPDICENDCRDADDGWCDDGAPGSDFDICELGSDCGDCGPRTHPGAARPGSVTKKKNDILKQNILGEKMRQVKKDLKKPVSKKTRPKP